VPEIKVGGIRRIVFLGAIVGMVSGQDKIAEVDIILTVQFEIGQVFKDIIPVIWFPVVFLFKKFQLDGGFCLIFLVTVFYKEINARPLRFAFNAYPV
jgi:hypothetical protein